MYASSVDGNVGRFHLFATVNSAAVNVGVQISVEVPVFGYFGYIYPEVGFLGRVAILR